MSDEANTSADAEAKAKADADAAAKATADKEAAEAKAKAKAKEPRRVRVINGERPTSNGGGYLGQEGEVIRRTETEKGSEKHVVEVSITSDMRRGQFLTLQPGEYEEI